MSEEIEKIKTMIVEGGDRNEINARVWLIDPEGAKGWSLDELAQDDNGRYHVVKMQGRMSFACPEYDVSIDAQKALEVDGWLCGFVQYETGFVAVFEHIESGMVLRGRELPTEAKARLYCWLCVKQFELEKEK